ncbi:hypothetical protein Hanom_Chr07g00607571 [Helianthus anomalus]
MASRTRSCTTESTPSLESQNLLREPEKEDCSFNNVDIAALKDSVAFPTGAIIRPFDREPFSPFSTSKNPLILKATKNEDQWQRKFYFVKRDSIAKGFDLLVYWLTSVINLEGFQLDELDSYSGLMQVKQETNPKPVVTSKPTSSNTTPKASTTSKSQGPSSRKRKEVDSLATSDVFPFENHGFTESSKFMTDFLNQGLECLVFLYEDACGLKKMLESKLKKA